MSNPHDKPSPLVSGALEEVLILLKRAVPTLGTEQVRQDARNSICGREDQQQEVLEVVEPDRRQQRDGEVRQAPDDDRDGGALGPCRRREDLRRDQPWWHQPADPEDRRRQVQDCDAWDAGREQGDGQPFLVVREAADQREQCEGYA